MNILSSSWIVGVAVAALGLLGLTMAARSVDLGIYIFGMLLFIFAVGFDFFLIKLGYDRLEKQTSR